MLFNSPEVFSFTKPAVTVKVKMSLQNAASVSDSIS